MSLIIITAPTTPQRAEADWEPAGPPPPTRRPQALARRARKHLVTVGRLPGGLRGQRGGHRSECRCRWPGRPRPPFPKHSKNPQPGARASVVTAGLCFCRANRRETSERRRDPGRLGWGRPALVVRVGDKAPSVPTQGDSRGSQNHYQGSGTDPPLCCRPRGPCSVQSHLNSFCLPGIEFKAAF